MIKKYRAPNDLKRTYGDIHPYLDTDLTLREYRALMKDLFTEIIHEVILNKRIWQLPFNLGWICVHARKRPSYKQPINWKVTVDRKKWTRHKNLHSDRVVFLLMYRVITLKRYKKPKQLNSFNVYNLRFSREHRRFLGKVVRESADDPHRKTYSVPYETPTNFGRYLR